MKNLQKTLSEIDPDQLSLYESSVLKLIDSAYVEISEIKPSDWCEKNRTMTSELTDMEGKNMSDQQ